MIEVGRPTYVKLGTYYRRFKTKLVSNKFLFSAWIGDSVGRPISFSYVAS